MAKKKKQAKGPVKQPRNTPPKQPAAPPSRLAVHQPLYERILFALALLGVLVTVHLSVWYGSGAVVSDDPVCGVGFNCTAVLANDPEPLGIPSATWGLLFYLGLAAVCAGIVYFTDAKRLILKQVRVAMVGIGFLYSLFLTIYQFFILSDRCLLCLISASIVTVMAVVLALYLFRTSPAPARAKRPGPAMAREFKLYGLMAVLLIVLAGVDYGVYRDQVPEGVMATASGAALPVAEDRPVDVSLCRYDPDHPHFSNMNRAVMPTDPIVGNPDAPVTLFEFLDPNCPHCRSLHPIMKAVVAKYPDKVRIVYKPVAIVGSATHSEDEVRALFLAHEQGKFEEMLELEMVHQTPRTGLSIDRLSELAEQAGMDPAAFRQDLIDGRFTQESRRARQLYMDLNFSGVPAVILEGQLVQSRSRSVGCLSYFIEQQLEAKGIVDEPEMPAEEASAAVEETPAPGN